jgi:hypothetical protein
LLKWIRLTNNWQISLKWGGKRLKVIKPEMKRER